MITVPCRPLVGLGSRGLPRTSARTWRRYQHSAWICFKLPSLISGEPLPAAQSLRGPQEEISITWATGNRDPAAPPTEHPGLDAERGPRLRARAGRPGEFHFLSRPPASALWGGRCSPPRTRPVRTWGGRDRRIAR